MIKAQINCMDIGEIVNGFPGYTFTKNFELFHKGIPCKRTLTYIRKDGIHIYAYSVKGATLSSIRLYAMTFCPEIFKDIGISYRHSLMVRAKTPKGKHWVSSDFTLHGRSTEKVPGGVFERVFAFARSEDGIRKAMIEIKRILPGVKSIHIELLNPGKTFLKTIEEKVIPNHEKTIVFIDSFYTGANNINIREVSDISADIEISFF